VLDRAFVRENPEAVKRAVQLKGEKVDIGNILALDTQHRQITTEVQKLREERNIKSKQIGDLRKQKQDASQLMESVREINDKIKGLEAEIDILGRQIEDLMMWVPNIPYDEVQPGVGGDDGVEVRRWGERKEFAFEPQAHWDLGKCLGILDFETGAKLAGSFFALFIGQGALLQRALLNFMLDLHTQKHGYTEVFPPFLVNRDVLTGTGQLPKLEDDMYHLPRDDFFLIPTAEVPVTNIYRDKVLSEDDLPIYLTAYTACFRREAGSYGKDTRGLLRVHQFDKVEMVKFATPETSRDELGKLLKNAEEVLQLLGLEYRVVRLPAGDLSFAAALCYDIEVWAPGVKQYLEVSSCSTYTDFQARRCSIRYRTKQGQMRYVHTINGSGLALPRVVVAIMETYQDADGTINVPEVLVPYMHGKDKIVPEI
jgi:seryl-tRNA synthetase